MKMTTDTGEMHKAAEQLAKQSEEYTTIYARLLKAASTMGEAWKAPDNLAFVDQINGFLEDFKNMATHIDQASKALELQGNTYENRVDANINEVKKLSN